MELLRRGRIRGPWTTINLGEVLLRKNDEVAPGGDGGGCEWEAVAGDIEAVILEPVRRAEKTSGLRLPEPGRGVLDGTEDARRIGAKAEKDDGAAIVRSNDAAGEDRGDRRCGGASGWS